LLAANEINNRKTPMPKTRGTPAGMEVAASIRTAVSHEIRHPRQ
jgi:hypothetical protein